MPRVRKIDAATFAQTDERPPVDRSPAYIPTPRDPRGITRIDQPANRTHGWFARVYGGGKEKGAFFADLKHGGVEGALAAAEAWRDAARADPERVLRDHPRRQRDRRKSEKQ